MIASKTMKIEKQFLMYRGGSLDSPTVAYETWGTLKGEGDNAILIFSGLSPSAHASSSPEDSSAGWWEEMIGPGLPVDTNRFFVICVNSLGSCFGSTGPASVDPNTGSLYRLSFPVLSLEDVAESAFEVLKALGVKKLNTIIGCSMGGMTALAFCAQHSGFSDQMISISSATEALPFAIAVRSLQREMICKDPKWNQGNYDVDDPPVIGQRLARKLGMMTYRSAIEWEYRFAREEAENKNGGNPFYGDFAVESYLENHANKFSGQFDANCYLYLSRASDLFDFSQHGGTLEVGFSRLKLKRCLVIGVQSDILFPIHQQKKLVDDLSRVVNDLQFKELDCIKGHDSFLVEMDEFCPVIHDFLTFAE